LEEFADDSPSEWISTDYENNRAPEQVSIMQSTEHDPECFEKLLVTTPEESMIAIRIPKDFNK
jgi:hypothetical protein